MPKYLIEREIPGAGQMSPQQLQGVAAKSCSVLRNLGPQIQWVQSYVTETRFIASTSHQTRRWSASTPSRAVSRPIAYRASIR